MAFYSAKLRVKELADALCVDSSEIIATWSLLKIPASSPLTSLTVDQCKEIIDFLQK